MHRDSLAVADDVDAGGNAVSVDLNVTQVDIPRWTGAVNGEDGSLWYRTDTDDLDDEVGDRALPRGG